MSDIRFNCPQCEQHLAVDAAGTGTTVTCPNCGLCILVPKLAQMARSGSSGQTKWWWLSAGVAAAILVAGLIVWQTHLRPSIQIGSVPASTPNDSKPRESVDSSRSADKGEKKPSSPVPITVSLGEPQAVPDSTPPCPTYNFLPDGHITVLPDGDGLQVYWSEYDSYRLTGNSLDVLSLSPTKPVLSKGKSGSFDSRGAWLYSVHRIQGGNLLGFYHGEWAEWPGPLTVHSWRTIGRCTSSNNGVTWMKQGAVIVSAEPRPAQRKGGGAGDFCVIRDETNGRWVCFYPNYTMRMAISADPDGKEGTWLKYHPEGNDLFTQPGLAGQDAPVPGLEGFPGSNPSVHWNTYLKRWVMVWQTWDYPNPQGLPAPNSICIATSGDLLHWEDAHVLLAAPAGQRYWYPTILGPTDTRSDRGAWLYYGFWPDKDKNQRQFLRRRIEFGTKEVRP